MEIGLFLSEGGGLGYKKMHKKLSSEKVTEKYAGAIPRRPLEFTSGVVGYPLLFVLSIWIVFWFEIRFGFDFNYLGIEPLSLVGLRGILFSPFIHGSMQHLFSNTIPLLVLSMALFYFYKGIAWRVLGYGFFLTGFLTWCIGEPGSLHIGASGVVYCLAGFLFFKGIWSKNFRLIALALIVVFMYGGLVWGVLPIQQGISWEGHLSGLLSGTVLAVVFRGYSIPLAKFEWEKEAYKEEDDVFMQHFDKDGNFIESLPPDDDSPDTSKPEIKYHYKEKK